MKLRSLALHPYQSLIGNGTKRFGILIKLTDEQGRTGWGDVAPLPGRSYETTEEAFFQLSVKTQEILSRKWDESTCLQELAALKLFSSVLFGLESALFSLLSPVSKFTIPMSAFFMGSPQEILAQAPLRRDEGCTSAKLKVSGLSFVEAEKVIHALKDQFRLRIDVNRAWKTADALQFFAQFAFDAFDYVEEPFDNPQDLEKFSHPLAVDESFPEDLSLEQLESLPTLKALIYKPMVQGGTLGFKALQQWADRRGIPLVLSSTFESPIGHIQVANLAHRLQLDEPIGIGTYHFSSSFKLLK